MGRSASRDEHRGCHQGLSDTLVPCVIPYHIRLACQAIEKHAKGIEAGRVFEEKAIMETEVAQQTIEQAQYQQSTRVIEAVTKFKKAEIDAATHTYVQGRR